MSVTPPQISPDPGDRPQVAVWTVRELLSRSDLRIPDYQRPYAWSERNVAELVDDIRQFTPNGGDYRIGTVILHRHKDEQGNYVLDVVDGQQRLTTLHLLVRVLRDSGSDPSTRHIAPLQLSPFGAEQTRIRVRDNHGFLTRLIGDWEHDEARSFADAVLLQCEVVVVTLTDLDEAFQMFDSQNTRGRALYPTDLLKAFHLREMGTLRDATTKRELVELWEDIPAAHVNALFSEYLFKIRRWSSGRPVPNNGFTTSDIGLFKGIRERDASNAENHWARAFVYAKNYTDDFHSENATLVRFGMMGQVDYPHQIDHPVLNGETFFRMVSHYYRLGVRLGLHAFDDDRLPSELRPLLGIERSTMAEPIDTQSGPGGTRSRYAYIRGLLDALLLYYRDRFGRQERDRFATLAARFVMVPRATRFAVKRETINNYVLDAEPDLQHINLFQEIRDTRSAREVVNRVVPIPTLYGDPDRPNETDAGVVARLWPEIGKGTP